MTGQSGTIGIVAAAFAALAVVLALLIIDVAAVVAARAQAATAADAAALAAAPVTFSSFGTSGDPRREAMEVAAANGAELMACDCGPDRSWSRRRVEVVVAMPVRLSVLGDRRLIARAAAEFRPVALGQP